MQKREHLSSSRKIMCSKQRVFILVYAKPLPLSQRQLCTVLDIIYACCTRCFWPLGRLQTLLLCRRVIYRSSLLRVHTSGLAQTPRSLVVFRHHVFFENGWAIKATATNCCQRWHYWFIYGKTFTLESSFYIKAIVNFVNMKNGSGYFIKIQSNIDSSERYVLLLFSFKKQQYSACEL